MQRVPYENLRISQKTSKTWTGETLSKLVRAWETESPDSVEPNPPNLRRDFSSPCSCKGKTEGIARAKRGRENVSFLLA